MEPFMTKWGLIFKAFGITLSLLVVRLIFDYLNLDVPFGDKPHHCIYRRGNFYHRDYFCGTLTDYKESEKIPSEIAASVPDVLQ